jgi:16S rRNA pseudouridine516 synthase
MSGRLDAFLARAGLGSRTDVKRLVRAGRVTLDGVVVDDPGEAVRGRSVACDGEPVTAPRRGVTLLLHKPTGVSCSHDPREAPLVFDLVAGVRTESPLECVGRLDRETSGLLVITDDGALNHRLTSPKRHVPKVYRVEYSGRLPADAEERFLRGLELKGDDAPTLPATLVRDPLARPARPAEGAATLRLAEGRYHQVRRMFAAVGAHVERLHRERIGALALPADLAPGAWREAAPAEIAALGAIPADEAPTPAPRKLSGPNAASPDDDA